MLKKLLKKFSLVKHTEKLSLRPSVQKAATTDTDPYTSAQRVWNERYGDYLLQAKNWRIMAIVSGIVSLTAVIGIIYIGAQSKFIPYIVEIDKFGTASAVGFAAKAEPIDQRVIKAYLGRFITDLRSVSTDQAIQKIAVDHVYSMLANGTVGLTKIHEFYQAESPFKRSETKTVSVELVSILPLTDKTWQVEWVETIRDLQGGVSTRLRWKASLTIATHPPQEEQMIIVNPLGLFITDIHWSQQL